MRATKTVTSLFGY